MFNPAAFKNAQLLLRNLTGGVEKVIKYYNAYCVGLTQTFDGTANAANFRWRFVISPQAIAVGGLFHDNNWPAPEPIVDWDWSQMDAACHPERAVKTVSTATSIRPISGKPAQIASVKSIAVQSVGSTCPDSVRIPLQNNVDRLCKNEKSACKGTDACPVLEEKMEVHTACINARTVIMMKCYKGGDANHKEQIQNRINGLVICQGIYFPKCGPKTIPVPQRVPSSVPPIAQPDSDYLKKMQELTGLTGAALIIYLIISEGSRLFPPRNLIPIP